MEVGLEIRGLKNSLVGPFDCVMGPGECIAVTGRSGAGKSRLLRMIADLDPHEGVVAFRGYLQNEIAAAQWRRQVMYFPAESGWWSDNVGDHFANRAEAEPLLHAVGLSEDMLGMSVHRLSTGERQRMALVRGLLLQPDVLLLDEPCSALDAVITARVEELLSRIRKAGTTIVLVTHDEDQVRRMADRRFRVLEGGRICEDMI
ncbi:hypothetical protein AD953_12865 [Acetobacter malorum]|uniref:ABC transporter domain-containing protein n=1 Tax=Acetobacter malorum TaxID=178901 RepID=A0A149V1V1_9PROT|nr:ATP-binding cassette domain-containing protein [Acetobacter malorum]KXV74187.1 hypothetical protein AD953_12865 [Acetobacter malorum]